MKVLETHPKSETNAPTSAITKTAQAGPSLSGRSGKMPMTNVEGWRQQPVTDKTSSFRSDELIGTDVRSAQGDTLASVEDLVMSPQIGMIAYMIVTRGGIFGFDKTYVPVPWDDFKITPNTKPARPRHHQSRHGGGPTVEHDQFRS